MWRFTSLESMPTLNNANPAEETRIVSATRTVAFLVSLVFMIIFTAILTIATVFEHFTNVCIGLLSILMMFFIVYSITAIRTFLKQEIETPGITDDVWTTVSHLTSIQESNDRISKDPPSYESVMRDSKCTLSPPPPPYSAAIGDTLDIAHLDSVSTTKTNSDRVVIDVTTLLQNCPDVRNVQQTSA